MDTGLNQKEKPSRPTGPSGVDSTDLDEWIAKDWVYADASLTPPTLTLPVAPVDSATYLRLRFNRGQLTKRKFKYGKDLSLLVETECEGTS